MSTAYPWDDEPEDRADVAVRVFTTPCGRCETARAAAEKSRQENPR